MWWTIRSFHLLQTWKQSPLERIETATPAGFTLVTGRKRINSGGMPPSSPVNKVPSSGPQVDLNSGSPNGLHAVLTIRLNVYRILIQDYSSELEVLALLFCQHSKLDCGRKRWVRCRFVYLRYIFVFFIFLGWLWSSTRPCIWPIATGCDNRYHQRPWSCVVAKITGPPA